MGHPSLHSITESDVAIGMRSVWGLPDLHSNGDDRDTRRTRRPPGDRSAQARRGLMECIQDSSQVSAGWGSPTPLDDRSSSGKKKMMNLGEHLDGIHSSSDHRYRMEYTGLYFRLDGFSLILVNVLIQSHFHSDSMAIITLHPSLGYVGVGGRRRGPKFKIWNRGYFFFM